MAHCWAPAARARCALALQAAPSLFLGRRLGSLPPSTHGLQGPLHPASLPAGGLEWQGPPCTPGDGQWPFEPPPSARTQALWDLAWSLATPPPCGAGAAPLPSGAASSLPH
jgi:hypothetical protein